MPDDVAIEKVNILQTLGAEVVRVRPGKYLSNFYPSPFLASSDR
jgi:cysteine synthase